MISHLFCVELVGNYYIDWKFTMCGRCEAQSTAI